MSAWEPVSRRAYSQEGPPLHEAGNQDAFHGVVVPANKAKTFLPEQTLHHTIIKRHGVHNTGIRDTGWHWICKSSHKSSSRELSERM